MTAVTRGRRLTSDEIKRNVSHHVGAFKDFDWYYQEKFPLRLLRFCDDGMGPSDDSPRGWVRWLRAERAAEDGNRWGDDFTFWWVNRGVEDEEGAVVAVEQRGGFGVEDGNHRVAVSHKQGLDTVPAYVGWRRRG